MTSHPYTRFSWAIGMLAMAAVATACTAPTNTAPPPSPTIAETATTPDTSTIRTLIDAPAEAPEPTWGSSAAPIADETALEVTYPSGGLTVSGVLRTPPQLDAPAPVAVIVHGSVDPDRYTSGGDLIAEQRALLAAGYLVFALDLRGYAGSDAANDVDNPVVDPGFGWSTVLDWGMALDVVNGLRLARAGALTGGDPERVGLVGHSLGGLLALDAAVIAPDLSDLIVALSTPSADFGSIAASAGDALDAAGLPPSTDPYWADVSPATFFERASSPLLLIHGTDDPVADDEWSRATAKAWEAGGQEAEAIVLEGADHALKPRRSEAADLVVTAFDRVLRSS